MNVLSVENAHKSFGLKPLIVDITFGLAKGDKVAIVGRNGAGKSTLLKMIGGKETLDKGVIAIHKSCTVGYLEQEPQLPSGKTVLEAALSYRPDIAKAVLLYDKAIQTGDNDMLSEALTQMDTLQAWEFEEKAKRILDKLGLTHLTQEVQHLSGGQQRRIALAGILLQEPDLLLLDEPTNHLDLDMIEWLENTLQQSNQTILFITHDRYFLDAVANSILELEQGKVQVYKAVYNEYLERKALEEEAKSASLDKVTNTLRKEAEWMRRQPKARGTKAKYRIDAFHSMESKKDQLMQGSQGNVELGVTTTRMGNKILEVHHLFKRYDEKVIFHDFSYTFRRMEKLGIIGSNGSGKSTLLNIITEKIKPDAGSIVVGETIRFGYYTQKGLSFKSGQKVIDIVTDIAEQFKGSDGENVSASNLLKKFLFEPARQYEIVDKLSGGEKKRLHLLTVLARNPNFLILDEPTNDLDLQTLSVLEDFLQNFKGCLMVVSHDRYFMDNLVDHLLVFEGNGVLKEFPGNYTDYRNATAEEMASLPDMNAVKSVEKKNQESSTVPSSKKKLSFQEQREYEQLLSDIEQLELEKKTLTEALSSGLTHEKLLSTSKTLETIEASLESKTSRWLELEERNS
ncbi:MAG: ABC-F family ATP-binding cassette domain-containing protein [Cytophagaceae bacterium]|jgi:ATP-binding cassette subfamily F protein uup|nr:ABC-F family ATP-binding cassette domain-containing protein [Cytophagaceae bacterium]